MSFEKALEFVLKWEGGYTLHKNPTEPYMTFAGIYQGVFPNWEGWKYLENGEIEKAKELVKDFYYIRFWKPLKAEHMPQKVAIAVFDTAVNLGLRKAIKGLQRTVRVFPDGIVGPVTLKAIREQEEKELVRKYLKRRTIYYARLDCEKFNIYKKGWINRVFDLMKFLEV